MIFAFYNNYPRINTSIIVLHILAKERVFGETCGKKEGGFFLRWSPNDRGGGGVEIFPK